MSIAGYDPVGHFYKMKKDDEGRQLIMNHVDCVNINDEYKVVMVASGVIGAFVGTVIGPPIAGTITGTIVGVAIGSAISALMYTKCCNPETKAAIKAGKLKNVIKR